MVGLRNYKYERGSREVVGKEDEAGVADYEAKIFGGEVLVSHWNVRALRGIRQQVKFYYSELRPDVVCLN